MVHYTGHAVKLKMQIHFEKSTLFIVFGGLWLQSISTHVVNHMPSFTLLTILLMLLVSLLSGCLLLHVWPPLGKLNLKNQSYTKKV